MDLLQHSPLDLFLHSRSPLLRLRTLCVTSFTMGPRTVSTLATVMPHLVNLNLSGVANIQDSDLLSALPKWPKLQSLALSAVNGVTDEVVALIVKHNSPLRRLDLSSCRNISIAYLDQLAGPRPTARLVQPLQTLNADSMLHLQHLNLNGCIGIDKELRINAMCDVDDRWMDIAGSARPRHGPHRLIFW